MKRFMPIANFVLIATVFLLPLVIGVLAQGQLGRVLDVEIGKAQNAKGQIRIAHQKHFDEKDFVGAIDSYKETIKHFPDSAEAVEAKFRIGNIYHWDKFEPELAIAEYEKVIANHSDTDYALESLIRVGECYAWLKQYDQMVQYCQQVIDQHSDSPYMPQAFLLKANTMLFDLHELEQADALYAAIIQQFPETEYARQAKLWQTYRRPKPGISEAEKRSIYQEVLKEAKDYQLQAKVQYMVAFSYFLQGSLHDAIREAQTVLSDYPKTYTDQLAQVHYFVGNMYERLEQYKQALNWHQRGLDQYPKSLHVEKMQRAIQRIERKQGGK